MEKRMEMKQKCKIVDIEERDNLEIKIEEIEDQISRLSSRESYEKVKDNFGALSGSDGSLCSNGIWKLKKKIFPKKQKSFPVVKKNQFGRLVSNPEELRCLYLQTFKNRLRHRKIKDEFLEIQSLKEMLCKKRLELVKLEEIPDWKISDIDKVLSSLKKNKSRDPHQLINEIFKPGVIGNDLKISLFKC